MLRKTITAHYCEASARSVYNAERLLETAMTDDKPQKPNQTTTNTDHDLDTGDPMDTLHVSPPNFRERIAAAQRARTNETRPSIEAPTQTGRLSDLKGLPANKVNPASLEETKPSPRDTTADKSGKDTSQNRNV